MRMLLNEYLYFKLNELSFSYVYAPLDAVRTEQTKQGEGQQTMAREGG